MYPDKKVMRQHGEIDYIVRYRTLAEMIHALQSSARDTTQGRRLSSVRPCRAGGWAGTDDALEYLDMLRNGWAHGVKGVEGLEGLSSDMQDDYTFVPSVCGTYLDVGAYQAGVPDCMLEYTPESSENIRGLTLVIDSCYSAGVNGDTVLTYAHSVMRLIAWLAAERIETAVYAVNPIQLGKHRYMYTTCIRKAGDVIQPERLAAMVHPSWLRRCWFAMLERDYYDRKLRECSGCKGSYGHVITATIDEIRACVDEAYSVILLPKIGTGDPMKAVAESISLKLQIQE